MVGDVRNIYRALLSRQYESKVTQSICTGYGIKFKIELVLGEDHYGNKTYIPVDVEMTVPYEVLNDR